MADGGQERWSPHPPASSPAFYDDLAPVYDRLYPDWDTAIGAQADSLDRLLRRGLGAGPHRVLDSAVGIGTQALGLGRLGHQVCGTDSSEGAVGRARVEAATRGLTVSAAVADMRALPFADGAFDAVVCADSFAHLRSVADAATALGEMARVTRPGGMVIVSIRDYEAARRDQLPGTLPQVNRTSTDEMIAFQVWDWHADGRTYDLTHFFIASDGAGWSVTTRQATLHAFTQAELLTAAHRAGLEDAAWHSAAETGYFQPVLVARAGSTQAAASTRLRTPQGPRPTAPGIAEGGPGALLDDDLRADPDR